MKTTNLSLQILKPVVAATVAIVIISGLSVQPARANYIVTLEQVGSNVVATGTGAIDLTGLSLLGTTSTEDPLINPHVGFILTGASAIQDGYAGVNGPGNFGSGNGGFASSGSGDLVGIFGINSILGVPAGYVSGTALSDTSTYNNATFSNLGVTPGTYVWSWGTGPDQKFTLDVRAAAAPDSGSTLGLLFLSVIALFGLNRLRHVQLA